jgi:hypothetical protein
MAPDEADLWRLLPIGYLLTIALETPVLIVGLSPRHNIARRLLAGVWLTACTYPIVILVLPQVIWRPLGEAGYWPYIIVAETFAPLAECAVFWLAFSGGGSADSPRGSLFRDFAAIITANLVSFLLGGWFMSKLPL